MSKRLFADYHPGHYQLHILPDLEKMCFAGELELTGRLAQKSKSVTLHARNIKISACQVSFGARRLKPVKISYSKKAEEVRIEFKEVLPQTQHLFEFKYNGTIDTHPHGLYRSSYKEGGKTKYLLASQFESTHARNLLPCVDEPLAKATFALTLTAPKNWITISNTLPQKTEVKKEFKTTIFKITPKMSAYLLAVVAGDWRYKEVKTKNGTIIRTYAIPSQIKFAAESLKIAKQALEFYEDYFDLKYPLENFNQIAIPDMEPGVGAMENWGCVIARADSLLIDPQNTSHDMRIYNTIVICHEIAHMWFGNLVTMAWWDDLWLNEGFAAWIEYKCANTIRPDWHIWREFISNDMARALRQDSYATTHPVYARIDHPGQIDQTFDDITYRKGASSIRMLEDYLGPAVFRTGIRKYMCKFAYQNATRDDLWDVMETVSARPVAKFMNAWLKQAGHPVLTYTHSGPKQIKLQQEIFRLNQFGRRPKQTWPIPVDLLNYPQKFMLDTASSTWTLKTAKPAVFKLNSNHGGFYRIAYSNEDLASLAQELEQNKLPDLDAIGLLIDQLDLTVAGLQSIDQLLNLLISAKNSPIAEVWELVSAAIGHINLVFGSDQLDNMFKPYIHDLIGPLYKRFGWNILKKQSHNNEKLQLIILALAARYDFADTPRIIDKLYAKIQEGNAVNPDIREIVLVSIARHGNAKDYDLFKKWFLAATNTEEERRLARAMTSFKQLELAKRSLNFMQSADVRVQDAYVWIIYLSRNRHVRPLFWNLFQGLWPWIQTTYGRGMVLVRLVEAVLSGFSDAKIGVLAKKILKGKYAKNFDQGLKDGLDVITFQTAWKLRDTAKLRAYLSSFTPAKSRSRKS